MPSKSGWAKSIPVSATATIIPSPEYPLSQASVAPCIGPVLGALLTLSSSRQTVSEGIFLLSAYSFGLAIPFILMPILSTKINLKYIYSYFFH